MHYRCKQIREEYTDFDSIQKKKDNTRPSNVYYGINWGYRSDETLAKSLDTGDLLYYNFDCDMCFSPRDTIVCKARQKMRRINPDIPSSMAVIIRSDEHRLLVMTDYFGLGEPVVMPYHEFLNKPFVAMVRTRQILPELPAAGIKKSFEFLKETIDGKQTF